MEIIVNGQARSVKAATLAAILVELGYGETKVATAVDGEFVPVADRAERQVGAGARLEIVAPRQGG